MAMLYRSSPNPRWCGTAHLPPASLHTSSRWCLQLFQRKQSESRPYYSASYHVIEEGASTLVRIYSSNYGTEVQKIGEDVSGGAPMATPPSRLLVEELKRDLVDELTRELKDVDTAAAALAAQAQRIEMTKLALQVQVETRSRAEKELLAAAENLRKSKDDYLLSGRVVPVGHDMLTGIARARHAFLSARDRYRSALEVAAKHGALLALVDRRLHREAIKLDLLEAAFKFSSKLLQYALRVAVLDGSLP